MEDPTEEGEVLYTIDCTRIISRRVNTRRVEEPNKSHIIDLLQDTLLNRREWISEHQIRKMNRLFD